MLNRKLISLHLSLFGALTGCGTAVDSFESSTEDGVAETAMTSDDDESRGGVHMAPASPSEQRSFAEGISAFNSKLYSALASQSVDDNFVYSPYSISSALTQVLAGAAGQTQSQIHAALQLKVASDRALPALGALESSIRTMSAEHPTIRVSNSVWVDTRLVVKKSYRDLLGAFVRPEVNMRDFANDHEAAIRDINRLVSETTSGLIPKFITPSPADRLTRFMLVNAVYFNGLWKTPFPSVSPNADFTTGSGDVIPVPTMNLTREFRYEATAAYQAVSIPFTGDRIAMTVVLPREGQFENVQSSLTGEVLDALLAKLGPGQYGTTLATLVDLSLPKLKLRGDNIDVPSILKGLGMTDAFDPRLADFSGISNPAVAALFISAIKHAAVFEVDEKGVKAAAATGIGMRMTAHAVRVVHPEPMKVNRPFIVFLHDHASRTTLFTARVKTLSRASEALRSAL